MLTPFQQRLLDAMEEGKWYSVMRTPNATHPYLPDWFYERQTDPIRTINAMLRPCRVLAIRHPTPGNPIVSKCYGLDKVRRADITVATEAREQ